MLSTAAETSVNLMEKWTQPLDPGQRREKKPRNGKDASNQNKV